jgi:hypothetical protein
MTTTLLSTLVRAAKPAKDLPVKKTVKAGKKII